MNSVVFIGWKEGINKIALTRLISEYAGYPLTQAKLSVDDIVDDIKVRVNVSSIEKAEKLRSEATKIGAICEITDFAHA
jgi:hypothetical protein